MYCSLLLDMMHMTYNCQVTVHAAISKNPQVRLSCRVYLLCQVTCLSISVLVTHKKQKIH